MSEAPLPNSPEAREPDGTLKPAPTLVSTTPEPETKTEPKPPQASEPEAKPEPQAGVPEKYEFALPKGQELDEKFAGEASAVFKDLGLTQEQAGKLVKLYGDRIAGIVAGPQKAYEDMRTSWRNETTADPTLGNGTDLKPEVKAVLGRAIDSMGALAAPFREAMDLIGAGDHPAVIRGLYALAKRVGEGTAVKGNGPAPVKDPAKPTSVAHALYPNLS